MFFIILVAPWYYIGDDVNAIIFLGYNDPRRFKRGVENVIKTQADSFDSNYFEKYYIFFGEVDDVFLWDDIHCYSIKSGVARYFKYNRIISSIKHKYAKTLIHSHDILSTIFVLEKIDVLTIHDGLYYLRKAIKHPLRWIHFVVEHLAIIKAKKIHFISRFSKSKSLYSDFLKKDFIISNTTPLETVKFNSRFPNDSFYNLFSVRGIQQRTRIDLLIGLAEKIKQAQICNIKIKIAGKGELLDFYKEKISILNLSEYIELLGFIPDDVVCAHYDEADLVIVTADYGEGFGLPIIEGYLFSKPVLASNVCAMPEVIFDSKYLFENDVDELFFKVIEVMNSGVNTSCFYDFYFSNYSNDAIQKLYQEKLYETL